MYFDAVQEILTKLADTNLKSTVKARLERELKELDPTGVIKKFVEEGGERPDISSIIGSPAKKKSSQPLRKPGNKSTSDKKVKRPTNDDDDEDDIKSSNTMKKQEKLPVPKKNLPKVSKDNDSDDSSNDRVLEALSESLEDILSIRDRKRLIDNLRSRLGEISDPKKRSNAYGKIAERLGDVDYWTDYYENKVKGA
jgi:hypothetical protein